jgi:hypothetical protein
MSARQDITNLLEQWRRLTEAEGEAIRTGAWPSVKELQGAKAGLQRDINAAMEKWKRENPGAAPWKHPFRREVDRLISLEVRNSELLAQQQQRLQLEKASSDRALLTLRRVQGSYAQKPETGWNSYS